MYALLCNYASETDHCWPSQATLASRLSCSVNSVKKYLAELVGEKLIAVRREQYRASVYYLLRPSELESREPKVARQEPKIDSALSKVGYLNNLNKQEEKENPPLPPAQPEPVKSPPASGQRFVGGGDSFSPDFEKAWDAYPKKEAVGLARSAWIHLQRDGQLPPLDKLLASIERFKATESWNREQGRFVPQMVNWLRGKRWLDAAQLPIEEKEPQKSPVILAWEREQAALESRRKEESMRLRPLFDAFAAKFPIADWLHLDAMACGTWRYLYSRGQAPSPSDVPDNNTLGIIEFMNGFKRKREQAAYKATHLPENSPINDCREDTASRMEKGFAHCGHILKNMGILQQPQPASEALGIAV
jgi:hypothetical protein